MRRRQLKTTSLALTSPVASAVNATIPTDLSRETILSRHSNRPESIGRQPVAQLLKDYFRLADDVADFVTTGERAKTSPGYFRFGPDVICFGRCASGTLAETAVPSLHDAGEHVEASGSTVRLSFDPAEVIDNLRYERYIANSTNGEKPYPANGALQSLYYWLRPLMGVTVRKYFQRLYFRLRNKASFPEWPVDRTVEGMFERLLALSMRSQGITRLPFIWFWPEGAPCCTIVTHDVETPAGLNFCSKLMDLNDSFGIKSSFQVVPEGRYQLPASFLENILQRGFEVNVHDLNHDGHLFRNHDEFLRRAKKINAYGKQFGAQGFRSAILYRNVDWFDALDFSYDMSVPNVAHLDPQKGGCCTVMPFFAGKILELPVTMTQDYPLFHILKDYSTRLWREQISMIKEKHGLISIIVHPDYIIDESARRVYREFLEYVSELRSRKETWIALPGEVAAWWRLRSEMNLVKTSDAQTGDSWHIEGNGSERARLAYATLAGNSLTFEVAGPSPQ
jgi:hypothetical protein